MSKKIAQIGVLIALAFVLSYLESCLSFNVNIPGIKLGIANVVVLVALVCFGAKTAAFVSVIRVVLTGLTFGNAYAFSYSIFGAVGSLLVMMMLKGRKNISLKGMSIAGAIAHNICQVLTAVIILDNKWLLIGYLPILLVAAVVTGMITGVLGEIIVKRLNLK